MIRISVVVATRDRPDRIAALLESLERQSLDPAGFEVVVVDDGSGIPVEPLVAPAMADSPLNVSWHRHPRSRGPAAARNTGWRAAASELVAFTDDDCRADQGWLDACCAAAGDRTGGLLVVQGRTVPDPAAGPLGPFSRTQFIAGPDGLFETCNIAYTRAALEQVGGFDEAYRRPCGEDVDLGRRVLDAGASYEFAPTMLVSHEVTEPGLWRSLRHTVMWTDAVRVLASHPGLRRMLYARLFWKRSHPALLGAIAGIVVGSQVGWGWALPAMAPYLALYMSEHRRFGLRALVTALPRRVLTDLTELGTMVAGSIRHRTLML